MILSLSVIVILAIIALGIEGLNPHDTNGQRSAGLNSVVGVWQMIFVNLVSPITGPLVVWLLGRVGPAPIHLSSESWMLLPSLFVLVASQDLLDYAFHRLQHKVPFLWSMHSFHHSDRTINASTGYRHFWLERPLLILAYLPLGLVFKADGPVIILASLVQWALPLFHHLNMRIGFGKWCWAFVSPQFHRIHHSRNKEHYDRNFSGFLPMWDVIFRTYYAPKKDEFPETGLDDRDAENLKDALLWPFSNQNST